MNTPLIIIGTGLAGYHLAKEYRKINPIGELILITEDAGHFYSKPQLSTAIQNKKTPDELIITPADKMQSQLLATLHSYTKVVSIDPSLQTLTLKNRHSTFSLRYGTLVLALGAEPKPYPLLEGFANHFRINSLQDYDRFIQENNEIDNCTIIGSGLVGCEFAHDLIHRLKEVKVITPDPYPLFGLVPSCIGKSLQQALSEKGMTWSTQTTLTEDSIFQHLLTAKCILTAIGISPSIELASRAGLYTQHGIAVNEFLQTNRDGIYAIGDCAQIQGKCRQFVAPILHSSRALAQTLSGIPTAVTFPAFPVSLKVSSYPVITLPPADPHSGEWEIQSIGESHQALFWDEEDCLAGYALSGQFLEARQSILAMLNQRRAVCTNQDG